MQTQPGPAFSCAGLILKHNIGNRPLQKFRDTRVNVPTCAGLAISYEEAAIEAFYNDRLVIFSYTPPDTAPEVLGVVHLELRAAGPSCFLRLPGTVTLLRPKQGAAQQYRERGVRTTRMARCQRFGAGDQRINYLSGKSFDQLQSVLVLPFEA